MGAGHSDGAHLRSTTAPVARIAISFQNCYVCLLAWRTPHDRHVTLLSTRLVPEESGYSDNYLPLKDILPAFCCQKPFKDNSHFNRSSKPWSAFLLPRVFLNSGCLSTHYGNCGPAEPLGTKNSSAVPPFQ